MNDTTHGFPGGPASPPRTPRRPSPSQTNHQHVADEPRRPGRRRLAVIGIAAGLLVGLVVGATRVPGNDNRSTPQDTQVSVSSAEPSTTSSTAPSTTTPAAPAPQPAPEPPPVPADAKLTATERWQPVDLNICTNMTDPLGIDAVLPPGEVGSVDGVDVSGTLRDASWHLAIPDTVATGSVRGETNDAQHLSGTVDGSLVIAVSIGVPAVANSFTFYDASTGSLRGSFKTPAHVGVTSDEQNLYLLDPGSETTTERGPARAAIVDGAGNVALCFTGSGTALPAATDMAEAVVASAGALWIVDRTSAPRRLDRLAADGAATWELDDDTTQVLAVDATADRTRLVMLAGTAEAARIELFDVGDDKLLPVGRSDLSSLAAAPVPAWLGELNTTTIGAGTDPWVRGEIVDAVSAVIAPTGSGTAPSVVAVTVDFNTIPRALGVVAVSLDDASALWRTWSLVQDGTSGLVAVSDGQIAVTVGPLDDNSRAVTALVAAASGERLGQIDTAVPLGAESLSAPRYSAHASVSTTGERLVLASDGTVAGALLFDGYGEPFVAGTGFVAAYLEVAGGRYISVHPFEQTSSGGGGETCPTCDV